MRSRPRCGSAGSPALSSDASTIAVASADTSSLNVSAQDASPVSDDAAALGTPAKHWNAVHTVGGVTQTSDARHRRDIVAYPLGLEFVRSLRPVAYRWKATRAYGSG